MFQDFSSQPQKKISTGGSDRSIWQEKIKSGFVKSLNSMQSDNFKNILDLSKFSVKNFNCFSSLGYTNIHFADLYESIEERYFFEDGSLSPEDLLKTFFGNKEKSTIKKFDVVLCWDLLNYLPEKNLKTFTDFLFKITTNQANLFALIYTKKTIPPKPVNFEIDIQNRSFYAVSKEERLQPAKHPITSKKLQGFFAPWYLDKIELSAGSIHDVHFTK